MNQQTVNGWDEKWIASHQLKNLGQAVIAFRGKFNFNPTNFEQLQKMTNEVPEMDIWFPEGFTDGWHHPFIFLDENKSCLVTSYGRDGKPGGKGIDCDLTSNNPYPNEASPTFLQFWNNELFEGMIDWSIICGGLAALLSLFTVRVPNLNKRGIIILAISFARRLSALSWLPQLLPRCIFPAAINYAVSLSYRPIISVLRFFVFFKSLDSQTIFSKQFFPRFPQRRDLHPVLDSNHAVHHAENSIAKR